MRKILGVTAAFIALSAIAGELGRIDARVEGSASVSPSAGAVYVQFIDSPSITDAIRRDLATHGFAIAFNKADAKQFVTMKGTVSIRSSNGKVVQENLGGIAEGQRVAVSVQVKEKPAAAQVPEGHYTTGEAGQPISPAGMSVVGGYPVALDLGDQGRGFAKRLLEKGIGNDATCPPEKCRVSQVLSQQTTIDVEVLQNGKTTRGKTVASMQGKDVNVDMLTARAIFLAMGMVRGGR